MRVVGALTAGLMLAGCGDGGGDSEADVEPTSESPTSTSSTPEPPPENVESEQCRTDAGQVLDILELALHDKDVRDLAGRLDTVDGMLPEAVAQCTGAVSRPVNEAQESLSDSFDAAMNGTKGGAKAYANAYAKVAEARDALDATG